MKQRGDAARLGEWCSKPVVQDAVVAFLSERDAPVLLREIADGCSITIHIAQRVMGRLHTKGFVERWKIPIHARQGCLAGTRQHYLYQIVEDAE